jgi:hypothetical protein
MVCNKIATVRVLYHSCYFTTLHIDGFLVSVSFCLMHSCRRYLRIRDRDAIVGSQMLSSRAPMQSVKIQERHSVLVRVACDLAVTVMQEGS